MAVSSYGSATRTSGVVRIVKDLDLDLTDRHVLIVEDIVDSGLTLAYLRKNLKARNPASLEVCALLVKEGLQKTDPDLKYTGFRIPPDFVIGYGLDVAERYRNLPFIAEYAGADPELLSRRGRPRRAPRSSRPDPPIESRQRSGPGVQGEQASPQPPRRTRGGDRHRRARLRPAALRVRAAAGSRSG